MKTTTRRTALAAPATLPLLPVSALATPADPAVTAFRAWCAANAAYERSFALCLPALLFPVFRQFLSLPLQQLLLRCFHPAVDG